MATQLTDKSSLPWRLRTTLYKSSESCVVSEIEPVLQVISCRRIAPSKRVRIFDSFDSCTEPTPTIISKRANLDRSENSVQSLPASTALEEQDSSDIFVRTAKAISRLFALARILRNILHMQGASLNRHESSLHLECKQKFGSVGCLQRWRICESGLR